ncbi:MAG: SPOR domain-containing protein, partial [Pseudomonadota bacterium]
APLETTGGADPITDPFANVPATTDTTVPDTSSGSNTPPVPNVAPDRPAVAETTPAPTPDVTQSRPIAGAAGSWAVQVGAFGSQDEAMNNYERLSSRIGTLVSGQIADVNVATVNGTTYYRLWLGEFSSRSEANDHCAALKSAGQDCLTRQRS